jgi:hypothetical protein
MTETIIETSSNKKIVVIDNCFNFSELAGIYTGIISLPFKISNSNAAEVQDITNRRLVSYIDSNGLNTMGFFSDPRAEMLSRHISDDFRIFNSYVNLGIRGDQHEAHSDYYWKDGGKTLLLYANKEWNRNWGGETVFFNDNGVEIEYVTPYIPGRIVIFDSDIPHMAKEQSSLGPSYRFTLAIKFVKNNV